MFLSSNSIKISYRKTLISPSNFRTPADRIVPDMEFGEIQIERPRNIRPDTVSLTDNRFLVAVYVNTVAGNGVNSDLVFNAVDSDLGIVQFTLKNNDRVAFGVAAVHANSVAVQNVLRRGIAENIVCFQGNIKITAFRITVERRGDPLDPEYMPSVFEIAELADASVYVGRTFPDESLPFCNGIKLVFHECDKIEQARGVFHIHGNFPVQSGDRLRSLPNRRNIVDF